MVLKWLAGVKMIELKVQRIHAYPSSGKDALAERGISLIPRLLCSIVREPGNVVFILQLLEALVYILECWVGHCTSIPRVIVSGETSMVWEY